MLNVDNELRKLNIKAERVEPIRKKDGITVSRIFTGNTRYVLKIFEKEEYLREINAYCLLQQLDIPTLQVIGQTECALLLEDIEISRMYRLGEESDLSSPKVAAGLGKWYRQLHDRGKEFLAHHTLWLYKETDYFTAENVEFIRRKTHTEKSEAWDLYMDNCESIRKKLNRMSQTLTYNDFYYTNLIVYANGCDAMMFDFNLLGQGYAYGDVSNVLSSLSEEAGEVFLESYGRYDLQEKYVDDVISPVVTLYMACQRPMFPSWGQAVLQDALNGVEKKLMHALEDDGE